MTQSETSSKTLINEDALAKLNQNKAKTIRAEVALGSVHVQALPSSKRTVATPSLTDTNSLENQQHKPSLLDIEQATQDQAIQEQTVKEQDDSHSQDTINLSDDTKTLDHINSSDDLIKNDEWLDSQALDSQDSNQENHQNNYQENQQDNLDIQKSDRQDNHSQSMVEGDDSQNHSQNNSQDTPQSDHTPPTYAIVSTHKKPSPKITSRLGAMGAYLASVYATHQDYQAVDLQPSGVQSNGFYKQGASLGKTAFERHIGSSKAGKLLKLASLFVPQENLTAISDAVYEQIATWASKWADYELTKDERRHRIYELEFDERQAWATDVANKNRVLASLGGVAGFLGLKGVVLDSAWLLMVSLKSIYQLSIIYNQPLTGTEGTKLAYGILAGCKLDKLQEKQVVMTALAIGETVFKNAQTTSLSQEFNKIGVQYQYTNYAKQLDELARYIDLDKFNPTWLSKLLPVGSSLLCTHYNNELIEEVLGVSRASFVKRAMALLDNYEDTASQNNHQTTVNQENIENIS